MAKKRSEREERGKPDNSFLEIDLSSLHTEWANQPLLAKQYADMLANARDRLDTFKANAEIVRSDVDYEIRSDPGAFEIEKITEPAVKSAIAGDDRVTRAESKIRAAKHEVDVLSGACTALEHRKRALEKLVDLWMASYFSEPRTNEAAKEKLNDSSKEEVRRRRK
jgi:hypothetical protein